jgi:eukaryotic-like serine/threonine-protein kinase
MTDDPRVQQLLEELHVSDSTPEEVCKSCPELLSVVRKRWRRIRRLQADLDALFPSPDEPTPLRERTDLPQIPGYEVEAVLGRGGMGIVFKARHLRLNRPVALKMALAGAYADPLDQARFQREAEAAAGMRHPNIVQVYDVGESNGRPYFTMEYIEGGSLAKRLAGTPQLPQQAAQILVILAGAVQVAHDNGIVHRDLKPANVLLTADSVPKISDFGLARRLVGEAGITRTGDAVGTPSYMAPEQAQGGPDAVGSAVDVYALGAILYELLTGRPPYRAATAVETVQQVISQEPAPPTLLNRKIPRDLETICLKCLHKEPERRYASAAALADDLRRFGEGRPIQARPVGRGERLWRWGRRNPTAATLLATALALVGLASGGSVWFVQQRTMHELEMRNEVGTAVAQAASLRKGFHFHEARELLKLARRRLEPAGPDDLRRQVNQGLADADLAERLDAARTEWATLVEHEFKPAGSEALYELAFAAAGLGREGDDVEGMAARVRDSAASAEITAALDDWASITPDLRRRAWLLAVAREADPDPARNRVRQPELWRNRAWLTQLAQTPNLAELGPHLTTALCRVARESGADLLPLMTAAQARFPQDFWLNLDLGWALHKAHRLEEALGYYRAALAIRPQTSMAHHNVGAVLSVLGRRDAAVSHFRESLRLDPEYAAGHHSLAWTMRYMGQLDEAIDEYGQALRIAPTSSVIHNNFGDALLAKGRIDEAIEQFRVSIRLDPMWPVPHGNLGSTLQAKGQMDEAIDEYGQALRLDASDVGAHVNLGSALYTKGRVEEAIDHFRQALRLDPNLATAHVNLGSALYTRGRVEEAIDHFRQALRLDPNSAAVHVNLGVSLYAAARLAVRDAAGQGTRNARLGEPERAAKRRQALVWLRDDLELTTKLLRDGKLSAQSVAAWQTDPALTSVRDAPALAKLPDAEREPWQRFWADVAAVVAADPVEQGRAHAARRDWTQAADSYALGLARGPTDEGHLWFEYAALLLLSGDRPGYVKACAHLVDRCGKDKGPRSYHVARACTLASNAVADMSLPVRLAEKELLGSREFWSLTEQGALAYRAGRFQEAVPLFEQSLRAKPKPGAAVLNWLWLALAYQRLEKAEEAQRWLGKAQAWLDQYGDGMPARAEAEVGLHLHNWLEAHVLRCEAESLIQPAEKR